MRLVKRLSRIYLRDFVSANSQMFHLPRRIQQDRPLVLKDVSRETLLANRKWPLDCTRGRQRVNGGEAWRSNLRQAICHLLGCG